MNERAEKELIICLHPLETATVAPQLREMVCSVTPLDAQRF